MDYLSSDWVKGGSPLSHMSLEKGGSPKLHSAFSKGSLFLFVRFYRFGNEVELKELFDANRRSTPFILQERVLIS